MKQTKTKTKTPKNLNRSHTLGKALGLWLVQGYHAWAKEWDWQWGQSLLILKEIPQLKSATTQDIMPHRIKTKSCLEKKWGYGMGLAIWVGNNWWRPWEEHWVLRDKEEVKEEEGLLTKKGTKPRQSTAQLTESGASLWLSGEGPAEEPRPALQLNLVWDPDFALGTSLHFSGVGTLICEMVTVILIS